MDIIANVKCMVIGWAGLLVVQVLAWCINLIMIDEAKDVRNDMKAFSHCPGCTCQQNQFSPKIQEGNSHAQVSKKAQHQQMLNKDSTKVGESPLQSIKGVHAQSMKPCILRISTFDHEDPSDIPLSPHYNFVRYCCVHVIHQMIFYIGLLTGVLFWKGIWDLGGQTFLKDGFYQDIITHMIPVLILCFTGHLANGAGPAPFFSVDDRGRMDVLVRPKMIWKIIGYASDVWNVSLKSDKTLNLDNRHRTFEKN